MKAKNGIGRLQSTYVLSISKSSVFLLYFKLYIVLVARSAHSPYIRYDMLYINWIIAINLKDS